MNECRGKILFFADVAHLKSMWVGRKIKIQNCFLQEFNIRLSIILDESLQDVLWYKCFLEFAAQYKSI